MKYDALVIGGGIAGMESALKLGDMGYKVLLVEKESSVGGKMILLSKVFPTLDCASCISTPKMGATIHHPNITVFTYSEVEGIHKEEDGRFQVKILRKPRYVDEAACTGCRQCEMVCNVAVPDEFNADMVSRRAAHIPFPQAVPKKAVIERVGSSPCTHECPAGIRPHGYVALVRSGEYEKAFDLVCEATPLVGSLGRACYAPCEDECTRGSLEGPLALRKLKRFVADQHYASAERKVPTKPGRGAKKVAIVGSGPAGLTAAWLLARNGYQVRVFEAAPQAGGMLRLALPSYRLPNEVVDDDIGTVLSAGVEIVTNIRIKDVAELQRAGYETVLLAAGTHRSTRLKCPGEDLPGVMRALDFLRGAKLGEPLQVEGHKVVVIGGGNVATDAARTAVRAGAASVQVVSLESLEEMPAHDWEVDEAKAEGVTFNHSCGVRDFGGSNRVETVHLVRCVSVFDEQGKFSPKYDDEPAGDLPADLVIVAAGMSPHSADFGVPANPNGTIIADQETLQTEIPYVFAAGDVVSGPSSITKAAGMGRRAAYMMDRYLQSLPLDPAGFDTVLPVVDKDAVLARQDSYSRLEPLASAPHSAGAPSFAETEPPMTEEEALYTASRCLDCGVCSECKQCVATCPADCIDLAAPGSEVEAEVDSVILATGFKLFTADAKPQYGFGRHKNVITGMQMDRLLAPTRPYNAVLRPGDGKVPDNIAYILCTGSRDETVDNPLCSKVCCMYSIKQNQLIMGALPLADVTVYYMDVRSVGKGYDEFFEQTKAMGANFVRGRISEVTEQENGNLILHYEDIENGGVIAQAEHDLVVLAVGVQPNMDAQHLFTEGGPALDEYYFVGEADEDLNPGATDVPGVFVAGTASGAKDIPESILHAGAAVVQAAAHIERVNSTPELEEAPV